MKPLFEIHQFDDPGYKTLMSYDSWRVAILNYIYELEPENITAMEKHNETDEVFVLLRGVCVLYFGITDESGEIVDIQAQRMAPGVAYNVKKGVYHTHVLSDEGKVLIVENLDTSDENSTKSIISGGMRKKLALLNKELMDVSEEAQLHRIKWQL